MKNSHELLQDISKTLEKQHKSLCCKLDSLILSSGGSVTLYNTPNSYLVPAGSTFTSNQVRSITIAVIGTMGQTASISVDGGSTYITYPIGYSASFEASSVFAANLFKISPSTSSVAINTLS